MRVGVFVFLLLPCLPACGDESAPQREPDPLPEVVLPAVERLGAEPAAEGRITVSIDGEGQLWIGTKACARADLHDRLRARLTDPSEEPERVARVTLRTEVMEQELVETVEEVEDPETTAPGDADPVEDPVEDEVEIVEDAPVLRDDEVFGGPTDETPLGVGRKDSGEAAAPPRDPGPWNPDESPLPWLHGAEVLLRIDPHVPWRVASQVLMALAAPGVEVHRTFIAVRDRRTGRPGAIAVFLPVARGLCRESPVEGRRVQLVLERGEADGDGADLAGRIAAHRKRPDDLLLIELRADPLARWGRIVQTLDAALEAAAYGFTFEGLPAADTKRTIPQWIERARAAGAFRVVVRSRSVEAPWRLDPVPPGRRDAWFGFSNAVDSHDEEEAVGPPAGVGK